MKRFDFFVKTTGEVEKERSRIRGVVFLLLLGFTFYLLYSELESYLQVEYHTQVGAPITKNSEQVVLYVDILFLGLNCSGFGFDLTDQSGNLYLSVDDPDVRDPKLECTFRKYDVPYLQTGCNLQGRIKLNRVENELHMHGPQKSYSFAQEDEENDDEENEQNLVEKRQVPNLRSNTAEHGHGWTMDEIRSFNVSHVIRRFEFEFSNHSSYSDALSFLPEAIHKHKQPLRNHHQIIPEGAGNNIVIKYTYNLKIINFIYASSRYYWDSFMYSLHESHETIYLDQPMNKQPGIFIRMDFSPYDIKYIETIKSFGHLIVKLCAVIGGMFVVSNLTLRTLALMVSSVHTIDLQQKKKSSSFFN